MNPRAGMDVIVGGYFPLLETKLRFLGCPTQTKVTIVNKLLQLINISM